MEAEIKPTILKKYIILCETHAETVKVVSYGIASISLVIALYRIRPFSKFRSPSSIPSHFLRNKIPLQGTVMRIEPSCGTLLMVDHKPLIPLPRLNNSKYLPVKLAGLNITANGISWLQTIVNTKNINLIPLIPTKEYLNCIVTMSDQNQEQMRIGEELVKLGFATVEKNSLTSLLKDKEILYYQKRLLKAQKWAERKRNGYWQFSKHPTLLWKIQQSLIQKVENVLPKFIVKQFYI
ncbi:protein C3orf33 isoform X2 [Nomia melanderi]|nr:protein C3orf33 isoform X2 [Nomia melanderi]XP_031833569.1 protein C3orf33 isoform X2 [Nomia melanderi]XP_031833570.1 protein C3orf33 isoform X2 [Nomia melanderi]XP_031833571.1 protein C3orf33 isoform X2 [Nomia melanderi]XP_031833572.1 protein C3orf33 isoform X2 [Nomia melanderi]XP_031833573.1 protein C3orf33 isoform X2 [Nomia melanderi]XP_031833575.1 protein C3orf33 isoform X2 [Nomia melanderi]XP_031833576.1 protein C3orf33 isoform X2 [Nomia melanderi]XP_031833577.1 protein C3orf33 isof